MECGSILAGEKIPRHLGITAAHELAVKCQIRWPLLLMTALFLPSLAVPLVVKSPHLYGVYETLLVFAGFALGYRRFWIEAGESRPEALRVQTASVL